MPLEFQLIRASEFIRLNSDEHLEFEASRRALQALAGACRKRGLNRALLDLRERPVPASPAFTPAQLAALVEAFHQAGFGQRQRLAVLYRSDPHGGARTFAFIGRIQGWQVQAFSDFEKALLWLSDEITAKPGRWEKGISIPIGTRHNKARKLPVRDHYDGFQPGSSTSRFNRH